MNWLAKYYDKRAIVGDPQDFLRHVGHTERGIPISDLQFETLLLQIRDALELGPDDVLLDLCCGNGVFTRQLAGDVRQAVGVDFSKELIGLATTYNHAENLTYAVQDVKNLDTLTQPDGVKFSKILMNAALQHFSEEDLEGLLQRLIPQSRDDRIMLFAFVPDFEKKNNFEATLKPGIALRLRRLLGRDLLGVWWKRDEVSTICEARGLTADFLEIDPVLEGGRYRMDIRVK